MSPEARPALVLAHGQLMTPEVWTPILPALDRIAAVQFAPIFDDSIAAMAERLLAEAPPMFDLVGLAMGGFVAFEVLRRAPRRVRRLALISTLAEADSPAQRERRAGYARLVAAGKFDAVAAERLPIVLGPALAADGHAAALVERMARDTGANRFLAQQRAILERPDSRPGMHAIGCPVTIVRGAADAIASAAHQRDMLDAMPHARFVEVEACGHLVPIERPAALASILSNWLETPSQAND